MESMEDIPIINETLEKDNILKTVIAVTKVIRPEWNVENVQFATIIALGEVNLVVSCHDGDMMNKNGAFVLKSVTEMFSGNTESVRKIWTFLKKENLGPKIMAFINNGICMELLRGEILTWGDLQLQEPAVWMRIAEKLAIWHSQGVLKRAQDFGIRKSHILWDWQDWDVILAREEMKHWRQYLPMKNELEEIYSRLERKAVAEFEQCFYHGDVSGMNLSINEDSATFFDFDTTGILYTQIDIARFFVTSSVKHETTKFGKFDKQNIGQKTNEAFEMNFLKHYLKNRRKLDGGPDVTNDDAIKLFKEVQIGKLFIFLRHTVNGPLILLHTGKPTFMKVSKTLWEMYPELENTILTKYG